MQGSKSMRQDQRLEQRRHPSTSVRSVRTVGWGGQCKNHCVEWVSVATTQTRYQGAWFAIGAPRVCAGSPECLVALVALRGSEGHISDQSSPTSVGQPRLPQHTIRVCDVACVGCSTWFRIKLTPSSKPRRSPCAWWDGLAQCCENEPVRLLG